MITPFLAQVLRDDALHCRWLNTLSYLEYVGARKIMKSQHEDDVDEQVLEHMVEELHHAHFLKKTMRKIFGQPNSTYDGTSMLAKPAAKNYLQAIDSLCVHYARDARAAYVLTSFVVETRALLVYTAYEEILSATKRFRVASILAQETRHLAEMEVKLSTELASFAKIKRELCRREEVLFGEFATELLREVLGNDKISR